MKMASRSYHLTVVYLFTTVVLSVLIQATLQASKETPSYHSHQTMTSERLAEKDRTNQISLLGATERLEKRFFFADKVSWSSWTHWSACSISCGKAGVQTRKRSCSRSGQFIVPNCPGSSSSTRSCVNHCPVNGHWSSWSTWSSCSVSCGGTGHRTRHRTCNHPTPAYGGTACQGSSSDTQTCNHKCPVDGNWGSWSSFSACSVSCCTGSKVKTRSCDHPVPAYGGKNCAGSYKITQACSNPCKGDAHWSSLGYWSDCSTTCDAGTMSRARTCVGQSVCTGPCFGHTTEKSSCNPRPCPSDAAWSHWTHWSSCTASCSSGTMTRSRTCLNMTVCTGGCHGSDKETTACDQGRCPEWSPWLFTPCSVTCGTGNKQGMRRCTSGHEEDCVGSALKTETCTESPCPVDGGWGNWHAWSSCSHTCGNGSHHRRRVCNNPAPAHMGQHCHGNDTEISTCRLVDCPSWGAYYEVGTCSVTCGDGVIQLQRDCSTGTNHDCTGSPYDEKPCSRPAC